MSSAEIRFRIRQKGRQSLEGYRWRLKAPSDTTDLFVPNWIKNWKLEDNLFPSETVHFLDLIESSEHLHTVNHQLFPQSIEKAIKDADEILEHKFHLLGIKVC